MRARFVQGVLEKPNSGDPAPADCRIGVSLSVSSIFLAAEVVVKGPRARFQHGGLPPAKSLELAPQADKNAELVMQRFFSDVPYGESLLRFNAQSALTRQAMAESLESEAFNATGAGCSGEHRAGAPFCRRVGDADVSAPPRPQPEPPLLMRRACAHASAS